MESDRLFSAVFGMFCILLAPAVFFMVAIAFESSTAGNVTALAILLIGCGLIVFANPYQKGPHQ